MIRPIRSHRGVWVSRRNSRLSLQLVAPLRTHSTRKVLLKELLLCFLSELPCLSFKLKLILKPAILLKFTHFRLCIENKQLRLLRVLGLPHILTVIYVFINVFTKKLIQYMWSLVRASPRCTWSATFPKMIKYFVEKKNTLNNERYRDLLISILSYDEVSAFLLWVKTRN